MKRQSSELFNTALAWFLIIIGTLGTLFWVICTFLPFSSDGDMTTEEVIAGFLQLALCTALLSILPGVAILVRQRRDGSR